LIAATGSVFAQRKARPMRCTERKRMDASAITEYFSPLMDSLKEQNQGRARG
jgi:hypothetical protein